MVREGAALVSGVKEELWRERRRAQAEAREMEQAEVAKVSKHFHPTKQPST